MITLAPTIKQPPEVVSIHILFYDNNGDLVGKQVFRAGNPLLNECAMTKESLKQWIELNILESKPPF